MARRFIERFLVRPPFAVKPLQTPVIPGSKPVAFSRFSSRVFSSYHRVNSAVAVNTLAAILAGGCALSAAALAESATEEEAEDEEQEKGSGDINNVDFGYFPEGLTVLNKHSAEIMLKKPETDILVAVVASGCNVCKMFKIVYEQVAASLKDQSVVVALIDGTSYEPIGFTAEEAKKVPRIRIYKKNSDSSQEGSGVVYSGRTVGPKDILKFLHAHSSVLFDLDKAYAHIDKNIDKTKEKMKAQANTSVDEEAKTSPTLQLSALSPCAAKMRALYVQWTLRDYPEYSEYGSVFNEAMLCLRSQENEDFWVDVVDIATDNLRVIDKAQKKEKRDVKQSKKDDAKEDDN